LKVTANALAVLGGVGGLGWWLSMKSADDAVCGKWNDLGASSQEIRRNALLSKTVEGNYEPAFTVSADHVAGTVPVMENAVSDMEDLALRFRCLMSMELRGYAFVVELGSPCRTHYAALR
jgi:hypothetical protein